MRRGDSMKYAVLLAALAIGTAAAETLAEGKRASVEMVSGGASHDFTGASMSTASSYLSAAAGVNIVIDPAVAERVIPSLRVHNMPLRDALNWITRLTGTAWVIKDGAIYVTSPETANARTAEMRIYDVRDITTTVTNFSAPEFIMTPGEQTGGMGVIMTLAAEDGGAATIEDIISAITKRLDMQAMPAASSQTAAAGSVSPAVPRDVWGVPLKKSIFRALAVPADELPAKTLLTHAEMAEAVRKAPEGAVKSYALRQDEHGCALMSKEGAAAKAENIRPGRYWLAASVPDERPTARTKRVLIYLAEEGVR